MRFFISFLASLLATAAPAADTVTEYFTFKTGRIDSAVCKMEGTLLVNGTLYVWNEGRCQRAAVQCRYGIGHRNNCLTPCRSIAADSRHWRIGQSVYIAEYKGRRCPFTGERMTGQFTVADVGGWIKGPRRFDVFMGVCVRQSGGVCQQYDSRTRVWFQHMFERNNEKNDEKM